MTFLFFQDTQILFFQQASEVHKEGYSSVSLPVKEADKGGDVILIQLSKINLTFFHTACGVSEAELPS